MFTQQNQTLETNQLTNQNQNVINLNVPQTSQPNLLPNINMSPQYNPNISPQNNLQYNPNNTNQVSPNISPTIQVSPNIIVQQDNTPKNITLKARRTITGPVKVGLEPKNMICPFCEERIQTQIETSTNIKALCTAIATLYIGFFLIQTCKSKPVSCDDCEHTCPNCGQIIGKYYAM